MRGALLIGGTTSDAGKSLITAGLCRSLARRGVSVAPFKAQNMSNNSVVTLDGGEIGRAQAMQAQACGLAPSVRFNPVLLKPGSDRRSSVVIRGRTDGWIGAGDYHQRRAALADVVNDELSSLRNEFDVVICEGAGSIAEINLRATDIANLGLAAAADIPVLVVGDIDRGGVLAHLFGTLAVLAARDQARVAGFIINKFRGAREILDPGVIDVERRTGRPIFGVLPYASGLWLDAEDSLSVPIGRPIGPSTAAIGDGRLSVAAIRLPRVSNTTDLEALGCEPGVDVRWVDDIASVHAADVVVLPGTRSTVDDLGWLRDRGLDGALRERAQRFAPIVALCGGYQMLGNEVTDHVESLSATTVSGMKIVDIDVEFQPKKQIRQVDGSYLGERVHGYEIHHGVITRNAHDPLLLTATGEPEGVRAPGVWATHWHGVLANDRVRRMMLIEWADAAQRPDFIPADDTDVAAASSAQIDLIADLVDDHLDMAAIDTLITQGVDYGLPTVQTHVV